MAPRRILLLRHAEKPDDPKSPDLEEVGVARAAKLATYIPATFGRPDFVFAAAVAKDSVRSYLTMSPLCEAIGIPLDASFKGKKYQDLATKLLSDPAYTDRMVVVCWSHNELPELAEALNARKGDYPDPWDPGVFNLILQLDYDKGGEPTVTSVTQPF